VSNERDRLLEYIEGVDGTRERNVDESKGPGHDNPDDGDAEEGGKGRKKP
jgi:hypothetical protein